MERHKKPVAFLQQLLNDNGAYPKLVVDGIFGAKTTAAVEGLEIPKYVRIALKEVGVYEIKGYQHNQRVLEYMKVTQGQFSDDETPWCGAFIGFVMRKDNRKLVSVPERAKSWKEFGFHSDAPLMGALAIKSRNGGGHVCIVIGYGKNGKLLCVGGNQSDEVNVREYSITDFEEFRVPDDFQNYPMLRSNNVSTTGTSEV